MRGGRREKDHYKIAMTCCATQNVYHTLRSLATPYRVGRAMLWCNLCGEGRGMRRVFFALVGGGGHGGGGVWLLLLVVVVELLLLL